MNKEELYDSQIAPLMSNIIATCKEHGIAMVASFAIPTDKNPDLRCSSMTRDRSGHLPEDLRLAWRTIYDNSFLVLVVTEEKQR